MKKIVFVCLLILMMSPASFADKLNVHPEVGTAKFRVVYTAERTCNTTIVIRDASGNRVFSETIRNRCNFIRPYDFSKLPYGNYSITATNAYSTQVTEVSHQPEPEPKVAFNVVKMNDNRYLLQIPNNGISKMRVTISGKEEYLYGKTIRTKGDFACMYTIQGLNSSDSVTFQVTKL